MVPPTAWRKPWKFNDRSPGTLRAARLLCEMRAIRFPKLLLTLPILIGLPGGGGALTFEVGPGMPCETIGEVPWESLAPGDSVLIHWRADPYHEKWVICREGSLGAPIVVKGIPGPAGDLPVVNGQDATTRSQLDYWNESRGIIKIGGASNPPDCMPSYIVLEGLDIRTGRPPYSFWSAAGSYTSYASNSAAVYVEKGHCLTFRNCVLADCANGLFTSYQSDSVLVHACHIHDNGMEGSIYQHNSYCESQGITYEFNHYGPLRSECLGNNLKDRSSGCVIRYSWIESGNRQLDLVDSDYPQLYNDHSYRTTFVYGNILIEPDGAGNSQICHYGGDSGTTSHYRKGVLHFYNNTVVSTRSGNTTLFRLSTNDESSDCRNNIVYVTASGYRLAMLDDTGVLDLRHDWFKTGWVNCHGSMSGAVNDSGGIVTGTAPGFWDEGAQEFWLVSGSDCLDAGTCEAVACLPGNAVIREYVKHQGGKGRPGNGGLDIGAYEYPHDGGVPSRVHGLTARHEGGDVVLQWLPVSADTCGFPLVVGAYCVYGADRAYYVPCGALLQTVVPGTAYTAVGMAQDPTINHFFRATGLAGTVEGDPSDPVGEWDFLLQGGFQGSAFRVQGRRGKVLGKTEVGRGRSAQGLSSTNVQVPRDER
jgi:hypothetical protein